MSPHRFQETEESSFFGSSVYDQVVPGDHFLRQLRELIPWERFSQKLAAYYHGGAQEGHPPYDPPLLLRMLLLAFLYNLSERQTEQMVNEPIPMQFFVGVAVDKKAPDHSTLTAFKARLKANGQEKAFGELLQEILQMAREKGPFFHTLGAGGLRKELQA